MAKVTLNELKSWRDWLPLTKIRVKPEQRKFTTNLLISFVQAKHPAVTPFTIHLDDQLIGYVMLVHSQDPTQWIIERLTIDQDYQRQGYGYDAADQLIDMVYEYDNSEMVVARYKPENDAARQLFAKLKFEEQEKMFRGRHIALLEFEFEEVEVEDEDELDDAADGDEYYEDADWGETDEDDDVDEDEIEADEDTTRA